MAGHLAAGGAERRPGACIFAPLNVAAFKYIPPQLRGAAVGLLALLRNEGGSVGTSMAQTIQERREQFHALRLGEHVTPLNPLLDAAQQQGQQFFMQRTGDPAASQHMALQVVSNLRDQQALSLAYFDVFWFCAVLPIARLRWCSSCGDRRRRRGRMSEESSCPMRLARALKKPFSLVHRPLPVFVQTVLIRLGLGQGRSFAKTNCRLRQFCPAWHLHGAAAADNVRTVY